MTLSNSRYGTKAQRRQDLENVRAENYSNLRRDSELLTTDQAADLLQVHPITLVVWRRENRGPRHLDAPDARLIRYLRTDVLAWLKRNRRNAASDNSRRVMRVRAKAAAEGRLRA